MPIQWEQVWPVVTFIGGQASTMLLDWGKDKRQARRDRIARVHSVDERWHEFELGKLMEINEALTQLATKLPAYIRARRADASLIGVSTEVSALTHKIKTLGSVLPDEALRIVCAQLSTECTRVMLAPVDDAHLQQMADAIQAFTRKQDEVARQIGERIRSLHSSLLASAERAG